MTLVPELSPMLGTLAAPETSGGVDFGWLVDLAALYLEPALVTLGAAFVGWLAGKAARLFGATIDEKLAARLHEAIERAVRAGVQEVAGRVRGQSRLAIENDLLASAARYLEATMPGALSHFAITPETLDRLIRSHLSEETLHRLETGEAG
ncbi:MAG: hypothetical protein KDI98_03985 [Hyphomicrobiaceae bacterium]|nr:hypothetical protein [Hyphomicrobiaceae bacterium]